MRIAPSRTVLPAVVAVATALAASSHVSAAPALRFGPAVTLAGGCGGEPSIDVDARGHVYVSAPKGLIDFSASCEGVATSTNGAATWYSDDGGRTFSPKISAGTLIGGGDTDTTVDPQNGDVYVADLEAVAADVCVSHDHGRTYSTAFTGAESCSTPVNLTGQAGPSNDREWVNVYGPTAAYPHKDLYLTYHELATNTPLMWRSQDGGPFLPQTPLATADPTFAADAANGTLVAKPVTDRDGSIYVEVTTPASPAPGAALDVLWMLKSADHGTTWSATKVFDGSSTGANLGLVFNDLAIDGGGDLYILALGNTAGAVPPANANLFTSTDHGATWRGPILVNGADHNAHVLAALHGGPLAGQVVVGYYQSTTTTDPNDVGGMWQYVAAESTDADSAAPTFRYATLKGGAVVHQGQVCTQGIDCSVGQLTGGGQGNRNLADFSSVTVDASGCALFTFADDGAIKADQSNFSFDLVSNDVTRQTAGCFPTVATAAAPTTPTAGAPSPTPPSAAAGPAEAAAVSTPNTSSQMPGGAAVVMALAALAGAPMILRRRRRRVA